MAGICLNDKKMAEDTDWAIKAMHIKTPSQKTQIRSLSGFAGCVGFGREPIGQLAPDHQPDDLFHRQLFCRAGRHPGTITHDRDVVRNSQDFLHLVRDIDDSTALFLEHRDADEMSVRDL